MNKEELREQYPNFLFLDEADLEALSGYLRSLHVIHEGERVTGREIPGEGNMNYTLRVFTQEGSFILKQARPWVEKYPEIPAPWDRVLSEAEFYGRTRGVSGVREHIPELLAVDAQSRVLVCTDLGSASDFTDIYSDRPPSDLELSELAAWLSSLHNCVFGEAERKRLRNRGMRTLNHEHIFNFPLRVNNGLDLDSITSGLKAKAKEFVEDGIFVKAVQAVDAIYLSDGPTLVHGDFFPGSWLRTETGIHVIDAEFCFFGSGEFDVGVCCAHFCLARLHGSALTRFLQSYSGSTDFDQRLMKQFAGVEIMRRLIGVAQLPLTYGLKEKVELLSLSRRLVLRPEESDFSR